MLLVISTVEGMGKHKEIIERSIYREANVCFRLCKKRGWTFLKNNIRFFAVLGIKMTNVRFSAIFQYLFQAQQNQEVPNKIM